MKKRVLALVLAMLMLLSITACGGNTAPDDTQPQAGNNDPVDTQPQDTTPAKPQLPSVVWDIDP